MSQSRPVKWSFILSLPGLVAAGTACGAEVPAVPQLLPEGTLAAVVVPDVVAAKVLTRQNPWAAAWQEPSLKAFRDGLSPLWVTSTNEGSHTVPALPLAEIAQWAVGPMTLACVPEPPATPAPLDHPAFLCWLDVGSDAPRLRRALEDYRVRLTSAGQVVRIASVGGLECHVVEGPLLPRVAWAPLRGVSRLFGTSVEAGSTNTHVIRWWLGQTNGLFIAATSSNAIAGVLDRLWNRTTATLDADPLFAAQTASRIGRSTAFAWIDLRPWMAALNRWAAARDQVPQADNELPMPRWTNILAASGLDRLQCFTLSWRETAAGTRIEAGIGVPADAKRGLLGMLAIEPRDASVPGEIPADVLRFIRIRLDFRQAWSALERMLEEVFPTARGVLDLLFKTASPTGGATDLRTGLVAALGDDLWQTQPTRPSSGTPQAPPPASLYRLSSTNAPGLVDTLKALTVLLPPSLGELQVDRTSPRTVYTIGWPRLSLLESPGTTQHASLSFCAGDDGVLFSGDRALLEPAPHTNAPAPPSLRDLDGLQEAAEVVGGSDHGAFGYENTRERLRALVEALRRETNFWERTFELSPAVVARNAPLARLQEAVDFTRLPTFDLVERHFGFRVLAIGRDDQGYFYRTYWPRPAALSPTNPPSTPSAPTP